MASGSIKSDVLLPSRLAKISQNQGFLKIELFEKEALENQVGVNLPELKEAYDEQVGQVLQEATLKIPENPYFHKGGKEGIHTEHMGYLLSDLQYMQRTYPNMNW